MKLRFFQKAPLHEEKRQVSAHTRTTKSGDIVQVQQHAATKRIASEAMKQERPGIQEETEQPKVRIGIKDTIKDTDGKEITQRETPARKDQDRPEAKKTEQTPKPESQTQKPESGQKEKAERLDIESYGKDGTLQLAGTTAFQFRTLKGLFRQEYRIPLEWIMQHPTGQIRERETKEHIDYLARLIEEDGQKTPMMVRIFDPENPTGEPMLVILSGNHRFLALKKLQREGKVDPVPYEGKNYIFSTANVRIVEKNFKENTIDEIMENYSQLKMTQLENAKSAARIFGIYKTDGLSDRDAVKATAKKLNIDEKKAEESISIMNLIPDLRKLCNLGHEKGGLDWDSSYKLSRFDKKDQIALFQLISTKKTWAARDKLISSYFIEKKVYGGDLYGNVKSLEEINAEQVKEEKDAATQRMRNQFEEVIRRTRIAFKIGDDYNISAKTGKQKEPANNYANSLEDWEVDQALDDAKKALYAIKSLVSALETRKLRKSDEGGSAIKESIDLQTQGMTDEEKRAYLESERTGRGLLHMEGVTEEIDEMNEGLSRISKMDKGLVHMRPLRKGCWEHPEEYTKKEFLAEAVKQDSTFIPAIEGEEALNYHKMMVSDAIARKKKLRPEVLEDYPELTRHWTENLDADYKEPSYYYEATGLPDPDDPDSSTDDSELEDEDYEDQELPPMPEVKKGLFRFFTRKSHSTMRLS